MQSAVRYEMHKKIVGIALQLISIHVGEKNISLDLLTESKKMLSTIKYWVRYMEIYGQRLLEVLLEQHLTNYWILWFLFAQWLNLNYRKLTHQKIFIRIYFSIWEFYTFLTKLFHFFFIEHHLVKILNLKNFFIFSITLQILFFRVQWIFFDVEGWKNLIKLIFIFRSRKSRRLFSAKGVNDAR